MAGFFSRKKKQEEEDEYIEDTSDDYLAINDFEPKTSEVSSNVNMNVKVFVLDDYDSMRDILDVVRGEDTICLIDIHLLRNKDPDELKRSVDKLKKTVQAVNGEIVAFHENWILTSPRNVNVFKDRD